MQKSSRRSNRYLTFRIIRRLAVMYALSGEKGERCLANSSEFTNSLQSSNSGSTPYEAVVFPEPLGPLMI